MMQPETAATLAYQMFCITNAEDINTGKREPQTLGVRAIDDFTLQVNLRSPTPFSHLSRFIRFVRFRARRLKLRDSAAMSLRGPNHGTLWSVDHSRYSDGVHTR